MSGTKGPSISPGISKSSLKKTSTEKGFILISLSRLLTVETAIIIGRKGTVENGTMLPGYMKMDVRLFID